MGRKKNIQTAPATTPANSEPPIDKAAAIKAAMATGLTSPKAIVDYIRDRFNMSVSSTYVSAVKGQTLKTKGAKGGKKQKPAGARKDSAKGGLEPRDLVDLAQLADRAGGVDQLQEYLEALKRIR